jgi:16S rRNA (uracil1498-N3)-methyltransferase
MRLHRFYLNQEVEEKILIHDQNLINQWFRVFRFKTGDRIILFFNNGFDYEFVFVSINKNEACLEKKSKKEKINFLKRKIFLFQSIIKKDNFEWIVEKGTEVGVFSFEPVISERSEKKNLNLERLNLIAKEATEQSGRNFVPNISEPKNLSEILENLKMSAVAFDGSGNKFSSSQIKSENELAIFVGPEGGFSDKERLWFSKSNIKTVKMSGNILRSETAAIIMARST